MGVVGAVVCAGVRIVDCGGFCVGVCVCVGTGVGGVVDAALGEESLGTAIGVVGGFAACEAVERTSVPFGGAAFSRAPVCDAACPLPDVTAANERSASVPNTIASA